MLKKHSSILMMFIALAIMLGHNFIPHHHFDFEEVIAEHHHHHHHSNDHHHNNKETENGEDEESDFGHLFSHFQHSEDDVLFLRHYPFTNSLSKQLYPSFCMLTEDFGFQNIDEFVRQNAPPDKSDLYNSQILLPSGLRAPPVSIV